MFHPLRIDINMLVHGDACMSAATEEGTKGLTTPGTDTKEDPSEEGNIELTAEATQTYRVVPAA